jgi:hypothetical protein
METLRFSSNWNQKLDCTFFTTIRLRNDRRYFVGAKFSVLLINGSRQINKGVCTISQIKYIKLDELDEYTAAIDTGYDAAQCRGILRNFYKNASPSVDWRTQQLAVILFRKETQNLQASLL